MLWGPGDYGIQYRAQMVHVLVVTIENPMVEYDESFNAKSGYCSHPMSDAPVIGKKEPLLSWFSLFNNPDFSEKKFAWFAHQPRSVVLEDCGE